MEPVAQHALLGVAPRQREQLREAWHGTVKGRVEAGNLRQLRPAPRQRADAREVVRLVRAGASGA